MNAMTDALMAQERAALAAPSGPRSTASVLNRPSSVPPASTPPLEMQLQDLEATIDARLAKYRRRERLSRATCVRASIGAAVLVLWQFSVGVL